MRLRKVTRKKLAAMMQKQVSKLTISGELQETILKCETLTNVGVGCQPMAKKRRKMQKLFRNLNKTLKQVEEIHNKDKNEVTNMDEDSSTAKYDISTVTKELHVVNTGKEESSTECKDVLIVTNTEENKGETSTGSGNKKFFIRNQDSTGKDGVVLCEDELSTVDKEISAKMKDSTKSLTKCFTGNKELTGKEKTPNKKKNKGKKQKLQNDATSKICEHLGNEGTGKRKKKPLSNVAVKKLKESSVVVETEEPTGLEISLHNHEATFPEPQTQCFGCRQAGHKVRDCPKLKEGNKLTLCFACGSTEHRMNKCKRRYQDALPYATCFICMKKGHISAKCPLNSSGIYVKGGSCHRCGSTAHLLSKCPERKANDGVKGQNEKEVVAFIQSNSGSADSNEADIESGNINKEPQRTKCRYFFNKN